MSANENGANSSHIDDVVPTHIPFALVQSCVRGLVITAVNERARVDGIAIGQPLADARAAFPGLLTRLAEPELDQARLLTFAHAVGRYGPTRNVEGEDGLWIDITGVAHLFGSEEALAQDIRQHFARTGYKTRIGIAETLAAAFAFARYTPQTKIAIAAPTKTAMALFDLPVEALQLERQTAILLKRLGLRCIGQLYNLPRSVLSRRFRDIKRQGKAKGSPKLVDNAKYAGSAHARAHLAQAVVQRLDQALGRAADPRVTLAQPPA
ncbi:MAG: Y-family DNA polymerase, partial [Hyphomicrobiaceae bacterium]